VAKVLLDTDIGSDIDDAVCLAYLLAQPQCELLGITTVSGEPVERAMLASALCRVAGADVPIYPGAADPLIIQQKQTKAQQAARLGNWDHATDFPRGEAVDFLRRTIRQHPGEIDLLTIGPLTNAGLLFRTDPEIPSLLKSLTMMCGTFTKQAHGPGGKEWNALLDPHATAVAYGAPVSVHRSIGIDVTGQVQMDADEVRERFKADLLKPVADWAEVWFEGRGVITFHDPLAAVTLFDTSVCTFSRGVVDVELQSERSAGLTYWQPSDDGRHEVALDVKPQAFFDHFFSVF